jgi:hypothetical protein
MATDRSDRLMTGMFRDRESAERAYQCVTSRGYTDKDVSLLMSDDTRTRCFPRDAVTKTELGTKAAEGAGIGAAAGAGLGALLIGLAATGIAIPLVPIIAMGPLAAALAGGGAGGAVGALIGALVGYGIPEERAKVYEQGIKEGGIVFGVTPRTDEDAEYIEREWTNARGEQIYRPGAYEAGRRV